MGQGRKWSALYLLSHKVGSVSGLHLEGTVLGPQIDRVGDAGAASFVDLVGASALVSSAGTKRNPAYHFGRLWAGDVELEVGVLLPVAEEQRELKEETVVRVTESRQCLRAGVAIETAFEALAGADQFLPVLKVVRVGFLDARCTVSTGVSISRNVASTYDVDVEVLDLGIFLVGASVVSEVTHDCECRADEARSKAAVGLVGGWFGVCGNGRIDSSSGGAKFIGIALCRYRKTESGLPRWQSSSSAMRGRGRAWGGVGRLEVNCEVGSRKGWLRGWRAIDPLLCAAGCEARQIPSGRTQVPSSGADWAGASGESYVTTQPFNQTFFDVRSLVLLFFSRLMMMTIKHDRKRMTFPFYGEHDLTIDKI